MSQTCTHLDQVEDVTLSSEGCEDCLRIGSSWVHLRLCMSCGHVGCCDNSPNRHATAHFRSDTTPSSSRTNRVRTGGTATSTISRSTSRTHHRSPIPEHTSAVLPRQLRPSVLEQKLEDERARVDLSSRVAEGRFAGARASRARRAHRRRSHRGSCRPCSAATSAGGLRAPPAPRKASRHSRCAWPMSASRRRHRGAAEGPAARCPSSSRRRRSGLRSAPRLRRSRSDQLCRGTR